MNGYIVDIKILLDQGADVNEKDKDHGMTPLHYVTFEGYDELALILIENGADVNAKDIYGYTPLDRAGSQSQKKTQKISALLRAHGGKTGAEWKAEQEKKKK